MGRDCICRRTWNHTTCHKGELTGWTGKFTCAYKHFEESTFFEQHQHGVVARLSKKNTERESETNGNQNLEMLNYNYPQNEERAR